MGMSGRVMEAVASSLVGKVLPNEIYLLSMLPIVICKGYSS